MVDAEEMVPDSCQCWGLAVPVGVGREEAPGDGEMFRQHFLKRSTRKIRSAYEYLTLISIIRPEERRKLTLGFLTCSDFSKQPTQI